MSEAEAFLADFDAELEASGETIRLRRTTAGPEGTRSTFEIKIPAHVRAAAPTDLIEPGADDTVIIVSPTHLRAKRWPGVPRKDDQVVVHDIDDPMNVQEVKPVRVGGVPVRWRLTCRG